MKVLFPLFLFLPFFLSAQVVGVVTDANGEALPFVSVYLEGSTTGTVTNIEGRYSLIVPTGEQVIVFRYIGYQTQRHPLRLEESSEVVPLDIRMEEQAIDLEEISVVASAEDPAYAIIRKAMDKRTDWLAASQSYTCRAYMKSLYRFTETPEKIMGTEIGDLGGVLDTNGQGIIYLSESESDLLMDLPARQKEIMRSSKVSGSDNAFSFNRASLMTMNFYKPTIDLGRPIVSPIAPSAFFYYKFRLEGSFFDDEGRLINKIAVLPRRAEDPVFFGHLYIIEDLWNFQSVDLRLTGTSMKQPVVDTLVFRQVYIPVQEPDRWMPFDQSLAFSLSIFGFGVEGYVSTQFSQYVLDPDFPEGLFGPELFSIEDDANNRDSAFWNAARPVPLTAEEVQDYSRKDSLKNIWESKPYLDSVDSQNNRVTLSSLLFGHTWENSWEHRSVSVEMPLNTVAFNPVQGLSTSLRVRYRQNADADETAYLTVEPSLTWGFSDKQFRGELAITRLFNSFNFAKLGISGGRRVAQLSDANPVSEPINNIYALFSKENYLKLYDKRFLRIAFGQEIANGLFLKTAVEYADRRGIVNASDYSFSKKEGFYAWNDPFVEGIQETPQITPFFDRSRALIWEASLRIRFAQTYWKYPNRKVIIGSSWPELTIHYRKGIRAFDTDIRFDLVSLSVRGSLHLGLAGTSGYFVQGGVFLDKRQTLEFMDRQHFLGNRMIVANQSRYLEGFLWLPYYRYSTDDQFVQAHFEHHFNGFILDKLPLIRKLGWKAVAGTSALILPDNHYWELNIGVEHIGVRWLRVLRADVVFPFPGGKYNNPRLVFSIGL